MNNPKLTYKEEELAYGQNIINVAFLVYDFWLSIGDFSEFNKICRKEGEIEANQMSML